MRNHSGGFSCLQIMQYMVRDQLSQFLMKYLIDVFFSAQIIFQCGSPKEDSELFDLFKFLISGLLTLLTGVVGTLGNILSISTLLHRCVGFVVNIVD